MIIIVIHFCWAGVLVTVCLLDLPFKSAFLQILLQQFDEFKTLFFHFNPFNYIQSGENDFCFLLPRFRFPYLVLLSSASGCSDAARRHAEKRPFRGWAGCLLPCLAQLCYWLELSYIFYHFMINVMEMKRFHNIDGTTPDHLLLPIFGGWLIIVVCHYSVSNWCRSTSEELMKNGKNYYQLYQCLQHLTG